MPLSKSKDRQRKKFQPNSNLNSEGITKEGEWSEGITEYHPLIYALIDKEKRAKLTRICEELGRRRLLDRVYYGVGVNSVSFETVQDMLEVTEG